MIPKVIGNEYRAVARLLKKFHAVAVLIGGHAVRAYVPNPPTHDIDITTDLDPGRVSDFAHAASKTYYVAWPLITVPDAERPELLPEMFLAPMRYVPEATGRRGISAIIRYTPFRVDLFLARSFIHQHIVSHPQTVHGVLVAAPEALITLKLLAGRPKDLEAVRALMKLRDLDGALLQEFLTIHGLEVPT